MWCNHNLTSIIDLLVGESITILEQSELEEESYCLCTFEEGCGKSCQNHIMYYECDGSNCRIGPGRCTNRAFAKLGRSNGNQYDYGVEVMETEDRGYGVRAMRTFYPNQMIVEYVGEIITQEECKRRMENEYKDKEVSTFAPFFVTSVLQSIRCSIGLLLMRIVLLPYGTSQ